MTTSARNNSERFTASAATSSAGGLRDSDSGLTRESHLTEHSPKDLCLKHPALSLGHFSTCGTVEKPVNSLTEWATKGPFTIRTNGSQDQMIVDADGNTIAWSTGPVLAHVICRLLNEMEEL